MFSCSFCGKTQFETRLLICGPRVFICNECVGVCVTVIADEEAAREERIGRLQRVARAFRDAGKGG